jgi:hypothetical protein
MSRCGCFVRGVEGGGDYAADWPLKEGGGCGLVGRECRGLSCGVCIMGTQPWVPVI